MGGHIKRIYPETQAIMRAHKVCVAAVRRAKHTDLIMRLKRKPCMDCQDWFAPCQMQFDHRPGEMKLFNVSQSMTRSIKEVLAEVAKCDIVCANCHALRTWKRLQKPSEVHV